MNKRRKKMRSAVQAAMGLVALLASAGVSLAQHEGHQTGGVPSGEGPCLAQAKEGLRIVEDASRQLEEARQTNTPQQMRSAISGLQAALSEIRTQLSLCVRPDAGAGATPGMEGMDHSKMGQEQPPASKSEKPPSAGMDHSKMSQEGPAAPAAVPAKDLVDPVCGMEVGTKVTEKATYKGKTYFFCSRGDREKFLSDPAKYVNR